MSSHASDDDLIAVYRTTARIFQADEKMRALLMAGQLAVSYYSPRGQEVIAAALGASLERDDYLVTTYRGFHDQIAKGVPLDVLFAEVFGRAAGTCKGKGGPMHVTYPDAGVMVTTGIVGSGMPIAAGLATSSQLRGDGRITAVCFGDGASNIGAFHESMNIASIWKLPLVFVCQNNQYAEATRYENGTSVDRIAERAAAYSMPGVTVDGNDAAASLGALRAAVERARSGEGPTLVEAMTYRFMGHYFGDQGHYMDRDEYKAAKQRDPVPALRSRLLERGIAADQLDEIDRETTDEVAHAAEFAVEAAPPDSGDLHRDVYGEAVGR